MDDEKFNEMAKSLVCLMDKEQLKDLLLGEQWVPEEIEEFIEMGEA